MSGLDVGYTSDTEILTHLGETGCGVSLKSAETFMSKTLDRLSTCSICSSDKYSS